MINSGEKVSGDDEILGSFFMTTIHPFFPTGAAGESLFNFGAGCTALYMEKV